MGRSISVLLTLAVKEYRVTCGLIPTIRMLEEHSEQVLFCIMLNTTDSDTHMQSTLVQAFCYERNISIIKVSFYFKCCQSTEVVGIRKSDSLTMCPPEDYCAFPCHGGWYLCTWPDPELYPLCKSVNFCPVLPSEKCIWDHNKGGYVPIFLMTTPSLILHIKPLYFD